MGKRDEGVRPASGQPTAAPQPTAPAQAGAPGPRSETSSNHMEKDIVNIGKSVVIKGELNGSEDLTIEGHVEGTIQLRDHVLTIGPNGRIKAQVFAKSVIVLGEVTGNVTASDKVDIRDNGPLMATSCRHVSRSPNARNSAAASTCSVRPGRRTRRNLRSRRSSRRRSSPNRLKHSASPGRNVRGEGSRGSRVLEIPLEPLHPGTVDTF